MSQTDDSPPVGSPVVALQKGRRGPTSSSCAECKRLKIRCSGTSKPFPCASCERRGVAAICPYGVMPERQRRKDTGGDAELRRRNQQLASRVKELEDALTKAGVSAGPSPISSGDQRTDDDDTVYSKEMDDHALAETFGTLTIEETGRTVWHGPHTPSINLLPSDESSLPPPTEHLWDESLPTDLMLLAAGFPFTRPAGTDGMKEAIRTLAPTYEEAATFAECFFSRAGWLGSPCTKDRFVLNTLMPLYASKSWEAERADVIALFFGIIAVGCIFDPTREHYDPLAFRLNKLCAASLALAKPIDRPTITALEALQTHLFFHQLADSPMALSRLWHLRAMAFRMVQALGLHRDSRAWGLDPALEQRRRWLFWQLNFGDSVISLSYGRPKFFNPKHYDCPFPEESSRPDLKGLANWRFIFMRDGLIPVLEEAFAVQPPPTYSTIMRIDSKIRNLPAFDAEKLGFDLMKMNGSELMQLFCVGGIKELTFLYLHRRFLFEACSDVACEDLSKHKFYYSVTAAFRSAVTMIRQLRGLYWRDKELSFRLFFLWLHGYSAFVALATLVIKRPECEYADVAMGELDSMLGIFRQAADNRRVKRCLPSMGLLRDKAFTILSLHHNGQQVKHRLDASVEQLLGGTPVVLRPAPPSACNPPRPYPPQQAPRTTSDMQFDLEALFGNTRPIVSEIPSPVPAAVNQPLGAGTVGGFNWAVPDAQQMMEGMENFDTFLIGYLNAQPTGFEQPQAPTTSWEEMLGASAI